MERIRVGPAFDSKAQVGPLISQRQLEQVGGYIQKGKAAEAVVKLGGERPIGMPEGDYFLKPTVFTEARETMAIVQEEIFGPVLCVLSFEDFDELIQRANDTTCDLATSIWMRDLNKAAGLPRKSRRVSSGLMAMVCMIPPLLLGATGKAALVANWERIPSPNTHRLKSPGSVMLADLSRNWVGAQS